MVILLALSLPRDEGTIPAARHMVRAALAEVGVEEVCAHDVEVALSEACTNVLQHAGPGEAYDVSFELRGDSCVIEVVDAGSGVDTDSLAGPAEATAERGRGLGLMRALVDRVHFASKPAAGTVVHLEKHLRYRTGSLSRELRPGASA